MTPLNDGTWMKIQIDETTLSANFKLIAKQKGYHTIGDLMNMQVTAIRKNQWFTKEMADELAVLFNQHRDHL